MEKVSGIRFQASDSLLDRLRDGTRPDNIKVEMARWIYKRDEAGKPRRFLSHKETMRWALLTMGKIAVCIELVMIVRSFFDPPETLVRRIAFASALIFALWMAASATLYFYVALSGGVMSRAERIRAEERERSR